MQSNKFNKYLLNIKKTSYTVCRKHVVKTEFICHLHIFDLDMFDTVYGEYINNLLSEYDIIVTFVKQTKKVNYPFTFIQIKNQVGEKLYCLQYLKDENIVYNYILFLHAKDINLKKIYFNPLIKNMSRIKLCKLLLKYKKISGIFPNLKLNKLSELNELYYNELCNFLNIKKNYISCEGNCFLCTKEVMDKFCTNYSLMHTILNDDSSNIVANTIESLWVDVILQLKQNYLVLNEKNAIDTYNIKINAIYFPQFHEIPENNEFWGDGFTEWTLLKPFENTMQINNINYPTLKPHSDIGYYTLNKPTLKTQISMAEKFKINGFIIYHYWFDNGKKVMYKPLECFLNDDITFPFAISWANESWSRRWDGNNNDVLIAQTYSEESFLPHIQYLIQFFKRPNYIKTNDQECILYIYNLSSIPATMLSIWETELKKHNLKIKIINTENSFTTNHDYGETNFLFEPMYSSCYVPQQSTPECSTIDYCDILNKYKSTTFKNKHLGLPLYWNNKVRRKKNKFLNITNFTHEHLELFLLLLLAEHVSKYKNMYTNHLPLLENFININAWNEWNEQAVLEPTTVDGYKNLTIIYKNICNL